MNSCFEFSGMSFADNPGRERQLINWEKLSALAMVGMQDDEYELKRATDSNSSYENARKPIESWKTSADRPWQTIRKLMPPAMAFQNFAKSSGAVDDMEKRISNIDAKLEKITHIVSRIDCIYLIFLFYIQIFHFSFHRYPIDPLIFHFVRHPTSLARVSEQSHLLTWFHFYPSVKCCFALSQIR